MKTLIVMTALAVSIATGASAMLNASINLDEIRFYAPRDADVSTLTDREIAALMNMIHSEDKEGEKRRFVRSFFLNND